MDRRQPSLSGIYKYDWPELRGLVPNAASPPPRMIAPQFSVAPYGGKNQQQQTTLSSTQLNSGAPAAALVHQPVTVALPPPSQTTALSSVAAATAAAAPSVSAPRRPIQAWRSNPSKPAATTSLPPPTTYLSLHGGPGSHQTSTAVAFVSPGPPPPHVSAPQLPLALLPSAVATVHSNEVSPLDQPLEVLSYGGLRATSFRKSLEIPPAAHASGHPQPPGAAAAPPSSVASAAVGRLNELDPAAAASSVSTQHGPQLSVPILPKRIVRQPIPSLKRLPPDAQAGGGSASTAAAAVATEAAVKGREVNTNSSNGEGGKQWLFQMPVHAGGGGVVGGSSVATAATYPPVESQGDDEGPSPKVDREVKATAGGTQGLPLRVKVLVPVTSTASVFTNPGVGQTARKSAGGSAHYAFAKKVLKHSSTTLGGGGGGVNAAALATQSGGAIIHTSHAAWMRRQPTQHAPPNSVAASGAVDDETQLQVEGCGFADVNAAAPASALNALESCVARERRAKEELQAAHEQVRHAFQQVVRAYFVAVESSEPREGRIERRGGGPSSGLSVAKCSVVVHTLVTTIQSYLRAVSASCVVRVRRAGYTNNSSGGGMMMSLAARRALAAAAADDGTHQGGAGGGAALAALVPPLLSVDDLALRRFYTPMSSVPERNCDEEDAPPPSSSMAAPESARTTVSSSSVHDMLLDQQTIARLKQLYFDYYDCETFVLDSRAASQQGAKVLPAAERTMSDVIEDHNVLEDAGLDTEQPRSFLDARASAEEGAGGFWYARRGEDDDVANGDVIEEEIDAASEDDCDNDSFAIPVAHVGGVGLWRGPGERSKKRVGSCDDPVAGNAACADTRGSSAASIALNRSTAIRDIYGSPASASDLCSPFAAAPDGGARDSCEVEDL